MTKKEAYECLKNITEFLANAVYQKLCYDHDKEGSEAVDRIVDATNDFMYQNFGRFDEALDMVEKWANDEKEGSEKK